MTAVSHSTFANYTIENGAHAISNENQRHLYLKLDTVTFRSVLIPALHSDTMILLRNCDGLEASDVRNVSSILTCDHEKNGDFCSGGECAADPVAGITCYCYPDGGTLAVDPKLGSCDDSAQITAPVRSFETTATKPRAALTTVLFSNSGDRPLSWQFWPIDSNAHSLVWNTTPSEGVIEKGRFAQVDLTADIMTTPVRAAPYLSAFNITSDSNDPATCSIIVTVDTYVQALPSATLTRITLHNESLLIAPGSLEFDLVPIDSATLRMYDEYGLAYTAKLSHQAAADVNCEVRYTIALDLYRGICALPALVAGPFSLQVLDADGSIVGESGSAVGRTLLSEGALEFIVTACPPTYFLQEGGLECACMAGSYDDDGRVCVLCAAGHYASTAGLKACSPCPRGSTPNPNATECVECDTGFFSDQEGSSECKACSDGFVSEHAGAIECSVCKSPQSSNANHTSCSRCVEGYYYRKGYERADTGFCWECPDEVECATHSELQDWILLGGYWRSGLDSRNVYHCMYGENACPGGFGNCTTVDCFCAHGHTGPLCSVCDRNYFVSWAGDKCEKCADGQSHMPSIITLASVFTICVVSLAVCWRCRKKRKEHGPIDQSDQAHAQSEQAHAQTQSEQDHAQSSVLSPTYTIDARVRIDRKQLERIIAVKEKILFQFAHVVSQFAAVAAEIGGGDNARAYPESASVMAGALGATNLNILSFLPMGCVFTGTDFYHRLCVKTIGPFAALLPLWCPYLLGAIRGKPQSEVWQRTVKLSLLWFEVGASRYLCAAYIQ